jgi:hypothetical protein
MCLAYVHFTGAFALQFGNSYDDKIGDTVTPLIFWFANVDLIDPDNLTLLCIPMILRSRVRRRNFNAFCQSLFYHINIINELLYSSAMTIDCKAT